jgi:hypothetical protein
MLHFCKRGGENLRELSIHDFIVKTTGEGKEYVERRSTMSYRRTIQRKG